MGAKEAFLEQIVADLPDGIKDHLTTPIPALVATTSPTDVDSAILVQGILAHNLNLIFKAFEGLTLAAVPMYIAQLNTVNQGMLLAGLEYLGGGGDFRIISPTDGGAYLGYFGVRSGEWYTVQIVRGTVSALTCSLGEADTFDLEETEAGVWSAEWATSMGAQTATFTATFADGTPAKKSVSFAVVGYPLSPPDGATVPIDEDFEITLDTQGEAVSSATIEIRDSETGGIVYTDTMAAIDDFLLSCIAKIPVAGQTMALYLVSISFMLQSGVGVTQPATYHAPSIA